MSARTRVAFWDDFGNMHEIEIPDDWLPDEPLFVRAARWKDELDNGAPDE